MRTITWEGPEASRAQCDQNRGLRRMASKRLVLASASPRRREIIAAIDTAVDLVAPRGDEPGCLEGESPEDMVGRLSLLKAQQVAGATAPAVVIGADTTVVLGNEAMGKPRSDEEATRMLTSLRGRSHRVVTGVTVIDTENHRQHTLTRSTEVRMRAYSDAEVAAYVASGEPLDKAGGYAVQDQVFSPAEWVLGCYLNVVGLPLCEVVTLLTQLGVEMPLREGWRPPDRCDDCALRDGREVSGT